MLSDMFIRVLNFMVIIYIIAPFVALVTGGIFYLSGHRIPAAAFDKITDLFKWYIVSVALVLTTKMIETTFTERETGIKEMQIYDKYAATILEADNIEQRWKLADYFSTVTPTERLRDRWIAYREHIRCDYDTFRILKARETKLLAKDTLSQKEVQQLATVQTALVPLENKLVAPVENTSKSTWVVVFTSDSNLPQSKYEQDKLSRAGISVGRMMKKGEWFANISQAFSSKAEAQAYINQNKGVLRPDVYIYNFEKWCPNPVYNDAGYYECR